MTEQQLQEMERRSTQGWRADWSETLALIAEVRRLQGVDAVRRTAIANLHSVITQRDNELAGYRDRSVFPVSYQELLQQRDAALAERDALKRTWDDEVVRLRNMQTAYTELFNERNALRAAHDAAQARAESLERKANEELDAKIRLAKVNEQLRAEARWNPLEDYHKRHVPGCRKHMYDQKSSPCSCQTEYDREFVRANAHERLASEQRACAAQAEAALTEARRVLRLVMADYPCTSQSCHRCVATRAAVAAVLAQEEK